MFYAVVQRILVQVFGTTKIGFDGRSGQRQLYCAPARPPFTMQLVNTINLQSGGI